MKTIVRIARLELSAMFYSPIAWLLLVIFTFMTSRIFTMWLGFALAMQGQGAEPPQPVTDMVFAGDLSTFRNVLNDLYLYIPLLTMGLISRELQSGSIKLLLSSPVRISEIVFGKYLAMMIYCLLLVAILVLVMIAGGLSIESMDYSLVVSGILGVYLLACSYSAIGLFLSSLTSYQVVAAISTFAVFGVLLFLGSVGQSVPVVGDILYWMSMYGRADSFRVGLISSKHVCYFLAVIALFLSFSILKLSQGRKVESAGLKAGKYLAATLAVFTFGYITSIPTITGYLDVTRIKSQTLTDPSIEIIEQIEGPWKITTFVNILDPYAIYGLPTGRNADYDRYERYVRFNPELEMDYILYYDTSINDALYDANPGKSNEELARQFAERFDIDFDEILLPSEMKEIVDLAPEQFRFIRHVEWNGQTAPIRLFRDNYRFPFEEHRSAALKRLIVGPKKVAVSIGHGERSAYRKGSGDYQKTLTEVSYRGAMISRGFEFTELSLDQSVPEDIDILIIADPETAYSEAELQRVQNYVAAGRNLVIAGEPGREAILNPLIERLGVRFSPEQVFQDHEDFPSDVIFAGYSDIAAQYGFEPARGLEDEPVVLTGTVAVALEGDTPFRAVPILVSDRNRETSDTLAYALTRIVSGKEQRIVVIGDADFMSLAELSRESVDLQSNNEPFIDDLFRWVSDDHYPVDTTRADFPDKNVVVDRAGIKRLKVVFYGVIPLALTVFAATLLIRRRRQ